MKYNEAYMLREDSLLFSGAFANILPFLVLLYVVPIVNGDKEATSRKTLHLLKKFVPGKRID